MNKQEIRSYLGNFYGTEPINPAAYGIKDPREIYGLTDSDIDFFKNGDKELKRAIDTWTGIDFPIQTIDDFMLVELAGMVEKLGVDGAISEFNKLPRRLRALYRAVARNHRKAQEK